MASLKLVLLGFLMERGQTGYELKKSIEEAGFFLGASHAAIYPTLHKLEAEGLAEVTQVRQSGRPNKKVYSITAAGAGYFRAQLADPPSGRWSRTDLLVRLFFGRELSDGELLGWVREYRSFSQDRIDTIRTMERQAGGDHGPHRSLCLRLARAYHESDLALLESLAPGSSPPS